MRLIIIVEQDCKSAVDNAHTRTDCVIVSVHDVHVAVVGIGLWPNCILLQQYYHKFFSEAIIAQQPIITRSKWHELYQT